MIDLNTATDQGDRSIPRRAIPPEPKVETERTPEPPIVLDFDLRR